MTTARLVAGMVSIAILGIAHPTRAQSRPCESTRQVVQVDGAPRSSTAIRERLDRAGVEVVSPETGDATCVSVHATVIQLSSGLSVELRDRDGRSDRRVVSTESVAATWIESWLRKDLGAPLMPAVFLQRGPMPRAAVARPPAQVDSVRPATRPSRVVDRWTIAAATESMAATDDSSWRTVSAGVCAQLGALCVGLDARFGEAGELTVNHGETVARRRAGDLMVSVRAPIEIGRAVLAPSIGVGLGWMHTRRDEPAPPSPPDPDNEEDPNFPPDGNEDPLPCDVSDPTFPECDPGLDDVPPFYIGDDFKVTSFGPRLQVGLGLTMPVTARVAVELGVGLVMLPTAHIKSFDPAEMDENIGPDGTTAEGSDPFFHLPGEPDRMTWWSIGLRVALP